MADDVSGECRCVDGRVDGLRKLTAAGKFSFTKPRPAFPDFYRLRLNNQLINFSVDSTETISFVADAGTFATSYSVEGSENCKAIKNITLAQLDANQASIVYGKSLSPVCWRIPYIPVRCSRPPRLIRTCS